ncbi:MAG: T9SS type A sorting domain-containing protein [Bacteroidota bacterium]|nr:T9SS type A sorting domain-containing protein [Bacteroidota bacterium]
MKKTWSLMFFFTLVCLVQVPTVEAGAFGHSINHSPEANLESDYPTDTLYATRTTNLPDLMPTSNLDLTWDGNYFWLIESLSGMVFKMNAGGACVDSFTTIKSSSIEYADSHLWVSATDYLLKLDTITHLPVDTFRIEIPSVFKSGYSCKDICYLDSALFTSWGYCWCGHYRLLKLDLKTCATVDLGDIPLYDNILSMNDTIWGATKELAPTYKEPSFLTGGRKQYIGPFEVSGILYDGHQLVVVDKTHQQLKFMAVKLPTDLQPLSAIAETPILLSLNEAGDALSLYQSVTDGPYTATIFSLDGKRCLSQTLYQPSATFDVRSLPKGQYLLAITYGKNILKATFIK